MACNCDKAPEFPTPAFIPGPIEIPINYRAVTIPADQGDDTTNPPLNGAYRNVVLKYAANNHVYIYSSDGIPVMLVGAVDFDDIVNRPKYNDQPMTSDTNIPDFSGDISRLEAEIQAMVTDFSYKGSVADYAHLPSDATTGDVYTTLDTGLIYVWDGSQWVALNRYPSVFTGTDGVTAGTEGLVPAPTAADAGKFLNSDGTWADNNPIKILTEADVNWPENNPTEIATWLLEPGDYIVAPVSDNINVRACQHYFGNAIVNAGESRSLTVFDAGYKTISGVRKKAVGTVMMVVNALYTTETPYVGVQYIGTNEYDSYTILTAENSIANNLQTNATNKALSAAQGIALHKMLYPIPDKAFYDLWENA